MSMCDVNAETFKITEAKQKHSLQENVATPNPPMPLPHTHANIIHHSPFIIHIYIYIQMEMQTDLHTDKQAHKQPMQ